MSTGRVGDTEAKGYYLDIQPTTPAIRAARASQSMTLFLSDGGSVQQLTLAASRLCEQAHEVIGSRCYATRARSAASLIP
ncbi:hypothetical protein [Paraburkholderia sediminicola]|uniref:hypothetical protein n=1 Tax=Paraburkholderia sediminicola TaxID=458836 RepID=UPI0038B6ED2F